MKGDLERISISDLAAFIEIARHGSMRAAALELGLSASALSHALKRLEDRLGVRLVNRTTRALSITVEGRELERYAATGLDTIGEGLAAIRARKQSEIQMLKISLSHDAARLLLWPVLWSFQQRWPNVHLDLVIEERLVDLVAEGFDGGIRYGDRVPEGMVGLELTHPLKWVVVAAPSYLQHAGRPENPSDLRRHVCIENRIGDGSIYRWELGDGDRMVKVIPSGMLRVSSTDSLLAATLQGLGLAYCLELRVQDEISSGALEVVMPDWASMGAPFMLYYPTRRQSLPGLKGLAEVIRTQMIDAC
ncbi:TPA: LysR family transcriptional regulator [Stenotrophomonas maltophilia]|uniref:LysR family transcriptional regulator n=5 Tax=Gammaproteobacteria TaxID=1236 RepID=A0AA40Y8A4_STEMA|nr:MULTISPECIES: LysR family transcriptional regulator [Gammaproteobacteria]ALA84327.1 LysR family transcriptional regulator [Stenotrophomonas maltophilia]EKU9979623.1 LysR family transcriptional regulator [Stenotrophomonas maltophilia]EKX6271609.1 LysR family transcriptional regulator [Stenotrophomonas maltophilia]ELF4108304.1 LysR family transcriptional regulator [Stenotrophomonas maltophilia]KOO85658.1 LysR family transcriptional regulator [Stenotrophomonas maltophilia]